MVQRVAVIGCGAAGLAALRHLAARSGMFQPMGFEQSSGVGGTWRYTEQVGTDQYGLPIMSSMYKNLKTNLPKEVMAFPDYPFPESLPSFMHHTDVLKYLEDYCSHFNLEKYIKFKTKVDLVKAVTNDNQLTWEVTYSSLDNPLETTTKTFDAVIVCVGHYSVPLVPKLEDQEVFQGTIVHSHNYREPAAYRNKVVVCLGAAASGQDVSLDIATVAKKVVISHNKPPLQTILPDNVVQESGIARVMPHGVVYKSGAIEPSVDVIMLCTGYRYTFPFLDANCSVTIEDERVTPLYKHIIHARYPSMALLGICKKICPFPQFDCQVLFFISMLDGSQPVPSQEEMEADIEAEYQQRQAEGLPQRYAHLMGHRQWAYNDELCRLGKFEPIPRVVQTLYDEVHRMRVLDLPHYKQRNYKLTGKEEKQFEVID